jgi:hypothetical protein
LLTIGAEDRFKLFCWVPENFSRPFPVDIGKNETVGGLKKMMKDEGPPGFIHLYTGNLDLWKVG